MKFSNDGLIRRLSRRNHPSKPAGAGRGSASWSDCSHAQLGCRSGRRERHPNCPPDDNW